MKVEESRNRRAGQFFIFQLRCAGTMSYIKNKMQEEHQRLQALYQKYLEKIDSFPKGTVSIKKRNKNEYLYLASRQGDRVKFDYIGSVDSEKARKIMDQVNTRKSYESKLKQVKSDLKEIGKVIHERKNRITL
jgi:2-oxo-4-hydroxy-4-carboxy--5-ureidoimidazoline (OHCU) decarboxylase